MADENREILRALARVFTPYAQGREDEARKQRTRFVHYTTADAALRIIQSKRFWMRNTKCMGDYKEVVEGWEHLVKFFRVQAHRDAFQSSMDACAAGAGAEAIKLFDTWWNEIQFNTYILSISEHHASEDKHGRLSMWRAFGRHAARAALVLNLPEVNAAAGLNVTLSPVAYFDYEKVEEQLLAIIDSIKKNTDFLKTVDRQVLVNSAFYMLTWATVSLKHEGFHEEEEWRVIYMPKIRPSKFLEQEQETVVIDGVPQIIHKIPLVNRQEDNIAQIEIPQLIDRVIIGPSVYPVPIWQAFVNELGKAGVKDADKRVVISNIPLRT